jgi:WD40 repeat protein
MAPEEQRDLQETIRSDLAHWRNEAPTLRSTMSPGQAVLFAGAVATTRQVVRREVLRLYDLRTNRPLGPAIWRDSNFMPTSVNPRSFSPDGKRFLFIQGKEVRVWDLAAFDQPPLVLPHAENVIEVAWSPDSRRIVAVGLIANPAAGSPPPVRPGFGRRGIGAGQPPQATSFRSAVHLWDLGSDRRPPLQAALECDDLVHAHFTPDGKTLVLLSNSGNEVVDAAGGKRVGRLADATGTSAVWATNMVFSPDSRTLALWSWQGGLRLWDLSTRRPRGGPLTTSPLANANSSLTFRPDGKVLFCHYRDYQGGSHVDAWDAATSQPLRLPWLDNPDRRDKALSADGALLAAWNSGADKAADVVLLDTSTGRPVGKPLSHDRAVKRLSFSPDARLLLTVTADQKVRFWSTKTGDSVGVPVQLSNIVNDGPIFGPRGKTVSSDYPSGLQIWDVATGRPLPAPSAPNKTSVLFSPDERTLLAQNTETISLLRLWDARTLRPLGHDRGLRALALSPDGQRAALVRDGVDGGATRVVLVRTDDFKPVGAALPHPNGCSRATFSPDSKVVLTYSPGGTARLWDAATGLPRGDPIEDADGADAFTPDSRSVWLAGARRIQVRATATGRLICEAIKHDDPVQKVLPGPDSQAVLTCSQSRCFLWDSQGRPIGEALPRSYGAPDPVFSPDGKLLACSVSKEEVVLRDTRTGRSVGGALSHEHSIQKIEFSPDGAHLLTESYLPQGKRYPLRKLHLWDVATGKLVRETQQGTEAAWAFSPSGDRVVLSIGTEVQLLHLGRGGLPIASLRHVRLVSSVSFSPDGRRILTVSTGPDSYLMQQQKGWGEARLWDDLGQQVGDPLMHADRITAAVFSSDSQAILTTSHDGTARLWDAETGRCLGGPLAHDEKVFGGKFSPDGRSFATWAGADWVSLQETKLWDRPAGPVTLRPGSGQPAAVTPDGAWQLERRLNGRVYFLWDALTGKPLGSPVREARPAQHAWLSTDGKKLLTVHRQGARLWDTATGKAIGPLLGGGTSLHGAALSPDARLIATFSEGGVHLWEASTGKRHGPPLPHPQGCRWLSFSPKGDALLTTGLDGGRRQQTLRLWDPATGKLLGKPWSESTQIFPDFSPDGRFVVSSTNDSVLVIEVKTGKQAGKFKGEFGRLSPDGKVLAVSTRAGFRRGACQLWEVQTDKKLGELPPDETFSEWSPDGKRLLTLSNDGRMRCWNAATLRPVGEPFRHAEVIRFGVFSADGQDVWTFNPREARRWDAATGAARGDPLVFPAGVQWPYLSPDKRAVLLSLGESFTAWDLETRKPLYAPVKVRQISPGMGSFGWLGFPSSRFVQAAHDEYTAELLDVATGRPLAREFPLDWWPPSRDMFAPLEVPFGVSPDRSTFFAPADAQTLILRDAATGEAFGSPLHQNGAISTGEYAPDGRTLLTQGGGEVRLWRVTTGKTLAAWQIGPHPWPHAFSPDGKLLVSGPTEPGREELCLWETNTGKAAARPLPHPGQVTHLVFSPDGKTIATVAGDQLRVWNAATRRLLWGPREHGVELTGLAFSPDGRVLAALGGPVTRGATTYPGQKAWLWEAATGRAIGEPLMHPASTSSVHFSPAGDIAVVGNLNPYPRPFVIPAGDFQVWDTRSGAKKARLVHDKAVRALAFRPDGAYLATLDLDGVVRLWRTATWECVGETPPVKSDFTRGVSVLFGADGRSVIATDGSGARRVWQPPYPLEGTPASLRAEAELRTGLTLNDEGRAHVLKAADWDGRRRP